MRQLFTAGNGWRSEVNTVLTPLNSGSEVKRSRCGLEILDSIPVRGVVESHARMKWPFVVSRFPMMAYLRSVLDLNGYSNIIIVKLYLAKEGLGVLHISSEYLNWGVMNILLLLNSLLSAQFI